VQKGTRGCAEFKADQARAVVSVGQYADAEERERNIKGVAYTPSHDTKEMYTKTMLL